MTDKSYESLSNLLARLDIDPRLHDVLQHVATACMAISQVLAGSAQADLLGNADRKNVQGEAQKKLDIVANEIFVSHGIACGQLAAMVSEEVDEIIPIPPDRQHGPYALLFDPLDGSSNVDLNMTVGSIFSILHLGDGDRSELADAILQSGKRQVAAGYAIYGPSTMLVLTTGDVVNGFTLDRGTGEFLLTHPDLRIPPETNEFAINMSRAPLWERAVTRYVDQCILGANGPRGRAFNMRWLASMVAETHRILMRGGIFLYPLDLELVASGGRLRLLYEANPMSLIVEAAGGKATTGREYILELIPTSIHQRVPVILGSANEVEYLSDLYSEAILQSVEM